MEARQRKLHRPGKPERPHRVEPLTIVDVPKNLADAPFLRRISMRGQRLGDGLQERKYLLPLVVEDHPNVAVRDEIDVRVVVLDRFVARRSLRAAVHQWILSASA